MSGTISAQQRLDVQVAGRALRGADGAARAGDVAVADLALDMDLRGPLGAPRLDGSITASGVETPQADIGELDLRIASSPVGTTEPAERFDFRLDARAQDVVLADHALDRALGGSIEVDASGEISTDGVADIAQARLLSPTFAGNFAGKIGAEVINATLSSMIADLSPFSSLAGMPLRGEAELTTQIAGNPSIDQVVVALSGDLRNFGSGTDALDGASGREGDRVRTRFAHSAGARLRRAASCRRESGHNCRWAGR